MRILFSGGGTGGSVSPLLAIYEEIKAQDPDAEFLWLGTKKGPEKTMVSSRQIPFKPIHSGKLRRYFDLRNIIDPLFVFLGFLQSLSIIRKFKPDYIVSAGGFVAVPVAWAGRRLKKKILIHQQDVEPGLANKLMAKVATVITVCFEKSLDDFAKNKTQVVGNAVRQDILAGDRSRGFEFLKFDPEIPTVMIIGGATGALDLNNLVIEALNDLMQICQVVHITGGKIDKEFEHQRYRSFDFLGEELKDVYAAADLIVSRAGMGVLTEIVALKKPAIIIPMPNTHQEANALEFFKLNAAALLDERELTGEKLVYAIEALINDRQERNNLSLNLNRVMATDAAKKIAAIIYGNE